jgi:hypothetical protein
MSDVSIVVHDSGWHEVRWQGRTEEVFAQGEADDARAYAEALRANGGPLFDEEEDA